MEVKFYLDSTGTPKIPGWIKDTYKDYFLDFTGEIPFIPAWIAGKNHLKLCIGYGDYVDNGKANTEAYPGYDVYLIYTGFADNAHPDPSRHLDIETNVFSIFNRDIVICDVNLLDDAQVARFIQVFSKKMIKVDHKSNGPRLSASAVAQLLEPGGEVLIPKGEKYVEYTSSPQFTPLTQTTFQLKDEWAEVNRAVEEADAAERQELSRAGHENDKLEATLRSLHKRSGDSPLILLAGVSTELVELRQRVVEKITGTPYSEMFKTGIFVHTATAAVHHPSVKYDAVIVFDDEGWNTGRQTKSKISVLCTKLTNMVKMNGFIHFGTLDTGPLFDEVKLVLNRQGFKLFSTSDTRGIIAQKVLFILEAEGDGNCFFYACWESARLQNIPIFDMLKKYEIKTRPNLLATYTFPVQGADKLQTVDTILKGLDALLDDKLQSLNKMQTLHSKFAILNNWNNEVLDPSRYQQQHVFAQLMRGLIATSPKYIEILKEQNAAYKEVQYLTVDDIKDTIEGSLTPGESTKLVNAELSVDEAIDAFFDTLPQAFMDPKSPLIVTQPEFNTVRYIFESVGLRLNFNANDALDGRTIFTIHTGGHFVAGIPSSTQISDALVSQADKETLKWKQDNSAKRSNLHAKWDWTKRAWQGGRNRTKKAKK